jgi:hypothetical protein
MSGAADDDDPAAAHDLAATEDPAAEDPAATMARLRTLVERTRPVSTADQRVLPVLPAVEALLPSRGLRRGSIVQVDGLAGATSMAFAVAAGPTRAGSWVACVGADDLGWAAAVEAGVDMERLVVVRTPQESWATVAAALVDAFDVVLCGFDRAPSMVEARRLQARARERGAVLIVVGGRRGGVGPARRSWPGVADLGLTVIDAQWQGLGEGWGHLRSRLVTIEISGRREAGRPRRVELLLPGPSGAPAPAPERAEPSAPRRGGSASGRGGVAQVVPLRRTG